MKLRSVLDLPLLYRLFSALVGAQHGRSVFVNQYVRPQANSRILDLGCGPGNILDHLPPVAYFGFDFNSSYIEEATRRYRDRGQFFCQRISDIRVLPEQPGSFDIVLAIGILHHLDDAEALQLLRLARHALRKGGRLVTFDGCYEEGQSRVARYLLSCDRGQFVRDKEGYTSLACACFMKSASLFAVTCWTSLTPTSYLNA